MSAMDRNRSFEDEYSQYMRGFDGSATLGRPNIIWIFGDQHRGQALSCNGDSNVTTPNIDNLATHGVNFQQAIAGFPICCPFRGTLLTGLYPHKVVPGHEYPMRSDQLTIADVMNEHGYRTAYFGKWHLDGYRNHGGVVGSPLHIVPPSRRGGFRTWIGYENNNSQWNAWVHGGEGETSFQYRLPGYETDELTNLLLDYIQEDNNCGSDHREPFFAVLSVQPPHPPYAAPAAFRGKHNPQDVQLRPNVPQNQKIRDEARQAIAASSAMIENLDWNLGRILNALEETGQLLNTHIMFFSDHGDMLGSHGLFGKVVPYEESIRIPFIIGGEMQRFYGRKCGPVAAPLGNVDIAPTTLGLCGIDIPDWMEGHDYSPYRVETERNTKEEPDSAFLQALMPREGVDKPWRGVVTADGWKYICFEEMEWLMFNLNEDPYEQVNLAHSLAHYRKRKALHERLTQWIVNTSDEFTMPRI